MTQIHILDKDVKVAFNMSTLIAYEQLLDKPYNPNDLDRTENRVALLYAAILSADRNAPVEMADIVEKCNNTDIHALDEAVAKEMQEFYRVPSAEVTGEEVADSDTEEDSKNV